VLQQDAIVVPSGGTVYAQLVSSQLVSGWHDVRPVSLGQYGQLLPPTAVAQCTGLASVHDMQVGQLPLSHMTLLTPPTPVLRYAIMIV
jgi:protein arginine N-methyltransferase 7